MESTWQAVQEHMDAKFFNGDGLGSSRNFSGGNEVDQVEDVLLNSCLRESKHGKFFDALIFAGNIFTREFSIDEIPHFGSSVKSNQAWLELIRAVTKDNSFRAGSGLDSKRTVTRSNGS